MESEPRSRLFSLMGQHILEDGHLYFIALNSRNEGEFNQFVAFPRRTKPSEIHKWERIVDYKDDSYEIDYQGERRRVGPNVKFRESVFTHTLKG